MQKSVYIFAKEYFIVNISTHGWQQRHEIRPYKSNITLSRDMTTMSPFSFEANVHVLRSTKASLASRLCVCMYVICRDDFEIYYGY